MPRTAAAPSPGTKQKHRRKTPKKRKPQLPPEAYQRLVNRTATFCDTLRRDPVMAPQIGSRLGLVNFRTDLQAIIRAQFPLRRGRPPDPKLDEVARLVATGKSVLQVARKQFANWDSRDPDERYMILKPLRQAVSRRRKPRTSMPPGGSL